MKVIDVWINCPDKNVAEAISDHLITKQFVKLSRQFIRKKYLGRVIS